MTATFTFVPANDFAKSVVKHKGRGGIDLTPYIEPLSNLKQPGDGMFVQLGEKDKASTIKRHVKEAAQQLGFDIRFANVGDDTKVAFSRIVKKEEGA